MCSFFNERKCLRQRHKSNEKDIMALKDELNENTKSFIVCFINNLCEYVCLCAVMCHVCGIC